MNLLHKTVVPARKYSSLGHAVDGKEHTDVDVSPQRVKNVQPSVRSHNLSASAGDAVMVSLPMLALPHIPRVDSQMRNLASGTSTARGALRMREKSVRSASSTSFIIVEAPKRNMPTHHRIHAASAQRIVRKIGHPILSVALQHACPRSVGCGVSIHPGNAKELASSNSGVNHLRLAPRASRPRDAPPSRART